MEDFYFLCRNAFFEKSTKAIVQGFVKNGYFGVGNGNEPFYVGMCVYMSRNYTAKIRVVSCLFYHFNYGFIIM